MLEKIKTTIFSKYLVAGKLQNVDITLRLFTNRKEIMTDISNSRNNQCNRNLTPVILEKFSQHMKSWIDTDSSSVSIYYDYHSKQVSVDYFNQASMSKQLFDQDTKASPGKDKVDLAMTILAPLAGKEEVEVIFIDDRFNPESGDSPLTELFCPFFRENRSLIPSNVTVSAFQYDPFIDLKALVNINILEASHGNSIFDIDIDQKDCWTTESEQLAGYELFDKKQNAFRAIESFQSIQGTGEYDPPMTHHELWDNHLQPAGIQYLTYSGAFEKDFINQLDEEWKRKSENMKKSTHPSSININKKLPIYVHMTSSRTQVIDEPHRADQTDPSSAKPSNFKPKKFMVPSIPNPHQVRSHASSNKRGQQEENRKPKRPRLTVPSIKK
ncbi:MAG: hypothetical protein VX737_05205 [Pseudomonadota bacterium]|nr:hypothetical protein [Pseudomonadota bacterium]